MEEYVLLRTVGSLNHWRAQAAVGIFRHAIDSVTVTDHGAGATWKQMFANILRKLLAEVFK